MGPDVHGRHLLGIPSPWLGQMKGLRFCSGDEGEGSGTGTSGSGERTAAAGKEAHWILQSARSSAWKAFLASVECRAAGSLPGVAVGGGHSDGPHQRSIPTFRHFREKLMTASVPWTSRLSSSSTAKSTPLDCPERLRGQKRCRWAWPPCWLRGCMCWVLLQLVILEPLVSQKKK